MRTVPIFDAIARLDEERLVIVLRIDNNKQIFFTHSYPAKPRAASTVPMTPQVSLESPVAEFIGNIVVKIICEPQELSVVVVASITVLHKGSSDSEIDMDADIFNFLKKSPE